MKSDIRKAQVYSAAAGKWVTLGQAIVPQGLESRFVRREGEFDVRGRLRLRERQAQREKRAA